MQYTYGKLRGKIIECFGSLGNFARAAGISATTLSRKMTGKTGFSQDDIEKWSALLHIGNDDYGAYFFN